MKGPAHTSNSSNLTRSNIEKYGVSVIIIEATNYFPSFAYSVGLWEKYNHPEIICFGFSNDNLLRIINNVADQVKSGVVMVLKKHYKDFFKNSAVEFIGVNAGYLPDYFGAAIEYYQSHNFPALQLVWTDRNNRFPWEKNFQKEIVYKQPLLDRNIEFKFREERNLAIFTTKQWISGDKPIVRVVHEKDGDWQFLTDDQTLADACMVALEQMTIKDPSLNAIFNLDYGEYAIRNDVKDNWERGFINENDKTD